MRDNPFLRRPAYRAVWIEMLFEAEHGMIKDNGEWREKKEDELRQIIWKCKTQRLQPGQLTIGTKQLGEWAGVPRGTVQRILETFKNEQMIEQQTSNKFSLITIKKWKDYQINEQQNEQQVSNKRATSEHTLRMKECKNVKKNNLASETDAGDGKEINEILSLFQTQLNGNLNYGNKTQREAVIFLLKKHGREKLERLITFCAKIREEQFAPVVTTPYQLKEKEAQIAAYWARQNNSKNNLTVVGQ